MQEAPDFLTRTTTEDVIIQTTLDQSMQAKAEEALKWVFDNKVSPESKAQAAIVVMSADGAVRAMVGGRQTKVAGAFNRATQALRQTGSAFKPFVYATALDLGYSPMDTVVDEPFTLNIPGSGPWSPKNYTKEFYGTVSLNEALRQSLNIPAVRISEAVGRENVRRVASTFGISTDLAQGPAIALGASESTLIEMTGAYAGILNQGLSVIPHGITDLRLSGETSLFSGGSNRVGEQVILKQTAQDLIFMMENVVRTGTGQRARFGEWEIAGKTGTTQAHAMHGSSVSPQTMWQVYGWGMTTTHRLRVSLGAACPQKFGAKRCSAFMRALTPNPYRCHVTSPPLGRVVHHSRQQRQRKQCH